MNGQRTSTRYSVKVEERQLTEFTRNNDVPHSVYKWGGAARDSSWPWNNEVPSRSSVAWTRHRAGRNCRCAASQVRQIEILGQLVTVVRYHGKTKLRVLYAHACVCVCVCVCVCTCVRACMPACLPACRNLEEVEVKLQPTVSQSWCQAPIWDPRTIFLSPWNFL
jgi:hypothetical protein